MYVMKSLQRLFLLVGCTFLKNLPLTFSCCIFRQVHFTCSFWYEGVSLDKKEIKARYKFLTLIELKFRKWMQRYNKVVSRNYQSTFKKFWFYSAILICLMLSYDIYPTFTFCFKGSDFHWFHDRNIFKTYQVNYLNKN